MYSISAIVWLMVLAKLDISLAYPFVGLVFILTMLLGFFVLREPVGIIRIIGTLLVVAGVMLVSRT